VAGLLQRLVRSPFALYSAT